MKNTMKQISMILFGTAAWMVCAVVAPMQQGTENTGVFATVANLAVPAAYADDDKNKEDDDKSKDKSSSVKTGSVCVSLALLTESVGKDKTKEDGKAEDEHKAKSDEEDYAKAEREHASKAEVDGDHEGKSDHDSKAKDGDDKAKDHEDKAKDHEDKSKSYSDTKTKVEALTGNCKALVKANDGSVSTEPGVWIPGTLESVTSELANDGGANTLIDLISSDGGSSVENSAEDASMESYREIRGE